ncbi:MAG: ferredoxin family protein [Synergistaceae bacterium]|nr:ferredoxin family protein [Synergistaceae bacterium]
MMARRCEITLDADGCKGCGYCETVCPMNVYERGAFINERGYTPYRAVRPELCVGCMQCYYVCPDFCLDVTPDEVSR